MYDLLDALFLVITASSGPLQIFLSGRNQQPDLFPTGMISLFPILSLLNYWAVERQTASETRDQERKPQ